MKFVLALAAACGLAATADATPQQFVVVQQQRQAVVVQRVVAQPVVVQRVAVQRVAAPAAVQVNVNERRGLFNRGSVVVNNGAQRVVVRR